MADEQEIATTTDTATVDAEPVAENVNTDAAFDAAIADFEKRTGTTIPDDSPDVQTTVAPAESVVKKEGGDKPAAKPTAEATNDDQPATEDEPPASEKPAESEVEKPVEFTVAQVRAGQDMGYTMAEIEQMDPAVMGSVFDHAGPRLSRKMSELGKLQQQVKGGPETAQPTTEDAKDAEAQIFKALGIDPFSLETDGLDDSVTAKLNKVVTALAGQLAEARTIATQAQQAEQAREVAARTAERDAWFAGIAKDFPEFGEGPAAQIEATSPEAESRRAVIAEAKAIMAAKQAMGTPITEAEARDRALAYLKRTNFKQAARREVASDLAQRRKGAVPRPAARQGPPPVKTADQRYADNLDKFARDHGISIPDE